MSLAFEVEVEFVDLDGVARREPLSSCWMVRFESALPIRKFSSHRGKRSFSGLWWSATTGDHVGFESWLERDQVMALDFDPDVVGLASQPFRIGWRQDGRFRSHVPDYFVRLGDGTGVVVDVRAEDRIAADDAAVFAATARACESVGWLFRRVGGLGGVLAANLRWLAGYRHPRCLHLGRAAELRKVFDIARPLMDGVGRVGDPVAVLPTLFHLMWRQVLVVDLATAPLSPSTLVMAGGGS
ncbi:MAG: TnsA-like heteromeric transposase endonuclease subunit [Mycobacteriales bacterium]